MKKTMLTLILAALLLAGLSLFAQEKAVEEENPQAAKLKDIAVQVLKDLSENNNKAADRIDFAELTVNGYFYGDDYWDAFDYYEEDYFIEDVLLEIHRLLHYDGDEKDAFENWTIGLGEHSFTAQTQNKKKDVYMYFDLTDKDHPYLYTLNVKDK